MKDNIIAEKNLDEEMEKIGVMEEGQNIMHEKAIHRILRLVDIRAPMANLIKEEMLAVGGDAAVHQETIACKVEKTDVLTFGTLNQYKRFIIKMKKQPHGGRKIAERVEKLLSELL